MRKLLPTKVIVVAIAIAAAALLAARYFDQDSEPVLPYEDHRAPLQNPVVEPDRPDLFEEPRIDEP